jgi:hypothetical protein
METKRLTVELDAALFHRLKLHAVLSDKPMKDVVRELLDRELPQRDEEAAS